MTGQLHQKHHEYSGAFPTAQPQAKAPLNVWGLISLILIMGYTLIARFIEPWMHFTLITFHRSPTTLDRLYTIDWAVWIAAATLATLAVAQSDRYRGSWMGYATLGAAAVLVVGKIAVIFGTTLFLR